MHYNYTQIYHTHIKTRITLEQSWLTSFNMHIIKNNKTDINQKAIGTFLSGVSKKCHRIRTIVTVCYVEIIVTRMQCCLKSHDHKCLNNNKQPIQINSIKLTIIYTYNIQITEIRHLKVS